MPAARPAARGRAGPPRRPGGHLECRRLRTRCRGGDRWPRPTWPRPSRTARPPGRVRPGHRGHAAAGSRRARRPIRARTSSHTPRPGPVDHGTPRWVAEFWAASSGGLLLLTVAAGLVLPTPHKLAALIAAVVLFLGLDAATRGRGLNFLIGYTIVAALVAAVVLVVTFWQLSMLLTIVLLVVAIVRGNLQELRSAARRATARTRAPARGEPHCGPRRPVGVIARATPPGTAAMRIVPWSCLSRDRTYTDSHELAPPRKGARPASTMVEAPRPSAHHRAAHVVGRQTGE